MRRFVCILALLIGCGSSQADDIFSKFGLLETIAGTGRISTTTNDWIEQYEGGPAINAELSTPHNAMRDGAGNIYISDKDAHAIRMVDSNGNIHTVVGSNSAGDSGDGPLPERMFHLNEPNGIWVKADGTIYIVDLQNKKIRKRTPDGLVSTFISVPGLAFGRGLWVSENEDRAYVASGTVLKEWTKSGGVRDLASGFAQLGNLAVAPDGRVAVTDRTANQVYLVATDGSREVLAGNGREDGGGDGELATNTGLAGVRAIWFHPEGGYFVGCYEGSQLWYVDIDGVIHLFLDGSEDSSTHAGDGKAFDDGDEKKISKVRAASMDSEGNLLIAENDAGFIRIVRRK